MIVALLTDYGRADKFVGVCYGAIAMIAPQAGVVDVTDGIPRFDGRRGELRPAPR